MSESKIKLSNKPISQGEYFPVYDEYSLHERAPAGIPQQSFSDMPIYDIMFNQTKLMWHDSDLVPSSLVYRRMRKYALPLFGEYVEEEDNLAFLEISAEFFEYLFFNNELWVWYDLEEEEFSMYIKVSPKDPTCTKYIDIQKHVEVTFASNDEVVKVMWNGYIGNNFIEWYELGYNMCVKERIFDTQCLLINKKIKITTLGGNTNEFKTVQQAKALTNLEPFLKLDISDNRAEPLLLCDENKLLDYAKAIYYVFDRQISELGRVANINDKEERKTTGENYKDIHAVACRQRLVLNQLKIFSQKAEKLWGVKLSFAVNGLLNKANLPADVEGGKGQDNGGDDKQIPTS